MRRICSGEGWKYIRGNAVDHLASLTPDSVDAFVTDPPYGIDHQLGFGRNAAQRKSTRILNDGRRQAIALWRQWVPLAYRAAKPDTAHIIFGHWRSPWMHTLLARHFRVRACIIWDRGRIGQGYWVRPRWEQAFLLFKGKPHRRGPDTGDIWLCPKVHRPRHPCEKPVALLTRCIELVSDPGQLICDPFAGIASTGVAALQSGRRFLGIELDPRFTTLARQRLSAAQLLRLDLPLVRSLQPPP